MQLTSLLPPLLAITTPIAALGKATVVNACAFEVSLWSVGSSAVPAGALSPRGGSYAETFVRDAVTGGKTLKVTRARDGLFTGAPQLNFAYNLDGAQVWYDLSTVFGDAFAGSRVVVASRAPTCPRIEWGSGTNPGGSQVKVCTSEQDVVLTLCA